ncbi:MULTISPECIES: hypothetical protein [unclassified Nocardioides]|uniref:hypothetical protein n=1 Tax=unclassified Nocardioides TaxID=2615069 RepID=UPI0002EE4573|nr:MULTISPECIES: hypothetical protein [unclassified Nocardioides]
MIIEVRPTPTLRRHRARIVGVVAGVGLLAVTLVSVAELASTTDLPPGNVTVSDPAPR